MPELYESEQFVNNQVPVRVFNHVFDGENIYTPLHWHRNIEFNLTTNGRISMFVDGTSRPLYPGDWMVVNSGELHSNHWIEPDDHFEGVAVQISKSFIDRWLGENVYFVFPDDRIVSNEIENVLRIFGEYHARSELNDLEKMELVFHFLIILKKYCINKKPVRGKRQDKEISTFKSIVLYIDDHFAEPIDLAAVAEEFHYSPEYLSRAFKEYVGHNFYTYLQNIRLMHCVDEIKENKGIRLLDCAINNGFPSVKSFNRTFRKVFNTTPSEWMKKNGYQ